MEYIQADIWVRFQRMQGNRGAFRVRGRRARRAHHAQGGSRRDQPAGARRADRGGAAQVPAGLPHQLRSLAFDRLTGECGAVAGHLPSASRPPGLIYSKPVEQFYDPVKGMFLADRYIKGECPNCHSKDQYGDACEVCSTVYAPTDLIDPYSTLSGARPVLKTSDHLFLQALRPALRRVPATAGSTTPSRLQPQVANKATRMALGPRAIRRSATGTSRAMRPTSAFRFPMRPGKYFYVWLDAPDRLPRLAARATSTAARRSANGEPRSFQEFLSAPDTRADPLHRQGHHLLPHAVLAGDAEVRGTALQGSRQRVRARLHHRFRREDVQVARHRNQPAALPRHRNESRVAALLHSRQAQRQRRGHGLQSGRPRRPVNSDLVGKYVNIASRAANFITRHFDGALAYANGAEAPRQQAAEICGQGRAGKDYEARELGRAMREIMALADRINQDFDGRQPWVLAKDPAKRGGAAGCLLAHAIWLQDPQRCCSRPCCPQVSARVARDLFGLDRPFRLVRMPRSRPTRGQPLSTSHDPSRPEAARCAFFEHRNKLPPAALAPAAASERGEKRRRRYRQRKSDDLHRRIQASRPARGTHRLR